MRATDPEITLLLGIIEEAYQKAAWHGPNLKGSIRGLKPRQAAWRPSAGRHNIWEIVVHAAYWKYAVRRRLEGEISKSFPLKGRNWFERPVTLSAAAWQSDRKLLEDCHRRLREAVQGLDRKDLRRKSKGSRVTNAVMIAGIAAHDVYHAGQIQMLKRLMA
jgi:uncharacterized damage-inducible protein DinB